jgi:thymidine phosphorylase
MDTRQVGLVVVELGGGRRKAGDPVDWRVGLSQVAPLGQTFGAGEPMAWVHAPDHASAAHAVARLQGICVLQDVGMVWQALPCVVARHCSSAVGLNARH